jgi:hypothetical protein
MKRPEIIKGNPMESSHRHWREVAKAIDDATPRGLASGRKREAIPSVSSGNSDPSKVCPTKRALSPGVRIEMPRTATSTVSASYGRMGLVYAVIPASQFRDRLD